MTNIYHIYQQTELANLQGGYDQLPYYSMPPALERERHERETRRERERHDETETHVGYVKNTTGQSAGNMVATAHLPYYYHITASRYHMQYLSCYCGAVLNQV